MSAPCPRLWVSRGSRALGDVVGTYVGVAMVIAVAGWSMTQLMGPRTRAGTEPAQIAAAVSAREERTTLAANSPMQSTVDAGVAPAAVSSTTDGEATLPAVLTSTSPFVQPGSGRPQTLASHPPVTRAVKSRAASASSNGHRHRDAPAPPSHAVRGAGSPIAPATPAVAAVPAPTVAQLRSPSVPIARERASPMFVCTPAAVARGECRPEGLATGQ